MNYLKVTLGYFLVSLQLISSAYSGDSIEAKSSSWLILGDSLSAAYGLQSDQGWVALLQKRLEDKNANIEVVNASISGETTSGGWQRLPRLMRSHQPNLLVIELGANDALRGQNLTATKQNLDRMIRLCLEADFECTPILLGIRLPTNYGPMYDRFLQKIYRDLAQQYQIPFDPFFLEDVALDLDLMQEDALHPNALAQPLILERVWRLLEFGVAQK